MKISRAHYWLAIAALFFLFMLGVTLAADLRLLPTRVRGIPFSDKLGHFVLYGVLAFLLQLALHPRAWRIGRIHIPIALLIVFALAVVDELQQSLSPYRSANLRDLGADWLGIISGVVTAKLLARRSSLPFRTNS